MEAAIIGAIALMSIANRRLSRLFDTSKETTTYKVITTVALRAPNCAIASLQAVTGSLRRLLDKFAA
jgi:hypothetical protein